MQRTCKRNKSLNSPGSNSWALVSGDERRAGIEWLARYGGNDAKCDDTEGLFIYMGSRRAFDGGMKERREQRERKRKRQGGRTGGRSKAATRSRGASVLFLPCPVHPSNFATLSRRDDEERWKDLLTLAVSRAPIFFPETFPLRNYSPYTSCRRDDDE